ncbi:MAG: HAMP domain-containing protein [Desulfomonile tiedjei]|nr:HAMP domain-containing protein [Desulfomonile tiedjei]
MKAIDPQSRSTRVVPVSERQAPVKTKRLPVLQTPWWTRKLVAIFSLLALIAIAANAVILAEVSDEIARKNSFYATQSAVDRQSEAPRDMAALYAYRNHMIVLLGITIACFGAIIYLFVKKVAVPLNTVAYAAKEISRGNLTVTVPSRRRHEVGDLGQLVNEVAANFQEILLLTGTTVGNANCALQRLEDLLKSQSGLDCAPGLDEQIRAIKRDLETLGTVVKNFEFYETRFDGYKVTPRTGEEG